MIRSGNARWSTLPFGLMGRACKKTKAEGRWNPATFGIFSSNLRAAQCYQAKSTKVLTQPGSQLFFSNIHRAQVKLADFTDSQLSCCLFPFASSIFFLKLSGRMSVQTSLM